MSLKYKMSQDSVFEAKNANGGNNYGNIGNFSKFFKHWIYRSSYKPGLYHCGSIRTITDLLYSYNLWGEQNCIVKNGIVTYCITIDHKGLLDNMLHSSAKAIMETIVDEHKEFFRTISAVTKGNIIKISVSYEEELEIYKKEKYDYEKRKEEKQRAWDKANKIYEEEYKKMKQDEEEAQKNRREYRRAERLLKHEYYGTKQILGGYRIFY